MKTGFAGVMCLSGHENTSRTKRAGAPLGTPAWSASQHVLSLKQNPEQHAEQLLPAAHTSVHSVKEGRQQSPLWHTSLLRHSLKQVPQWFLELFRSRQRPPQLVKPSLQTHLPPAQRAPLQQRLPPPHRLPTRWHRACAGLALNSRPPPPRTVATSILSIRRREIWSVATARASASKRSGLTTATCSFFIGAGKEENPPLSHYVVEHAAQPNEAHLPGGHFFETFWRPAENASPSIS
jgi:hypothetical protein